LKIIKLLNYFKSVLWRRLLGFFTSGSKNKQFPWSTAKWYNWFKSC